MLPGTMWWMKSKATVCFAFAWGIWLAHYGHVTMWYTLITGEIESGSFSIINDRQGLDARAGPENERVKGLENGCVCMHTHKLTYKKWISVSETLVFCLFTYNKNLFLFFLFFLIWWLLEIEPIGSWILGKCSTLMKSESSPCFVQRDVGVGSHMTVFLKCLMTHYLRACALWDEPCNPGSHSYHHPPSPRFALWS